MRKKRFMMTLILIAGVIILVSAVLEMRNRKKLRERKLADIARRRKELEQKEREENHD